MKIAAQTYLNNQFRNAEESSAYQSARALESRFHAVAQDMLQLDDSPLDRNSTKGIVVVDQAQFSPGVTSSGEARFDSEKRPISLNLRESDNTSLKAGYSHGALGLGESRFVIEFEPCCYQDHRVAGFFADGTVEFKNKPVYFPTHRG